MTDGSHAVTKRIRVSSLARAYLITAAFVGIGTTFNIFTTIHDAAEHGQALPAWEPASWEYTSAAATLISCFVIYAAVLRAPPLRTPWPRFAVVHAVASLAYSVLHIVLMNAMRVAIYSAIGRRYSFGEAGFWYEYRKDLISYAVIATIFWLCTREPQPGVGPENERRTIDIRDGRKLLRIPVDQIRAVHAAGNYVEYMLADDRTLLIRQSLSVAYAQLGDSDFVRTHRSWAVNARHVRALGAVRAGDFEVELEGGIKAPLSRRFPDALARIRAARN